MRSLVDPVINTELGVWQRSFIIKTLLAQGNNDRNLTDLKTYAKNELTPGIYHSSIMLDLPLAVFLCAERVTDER